MASKVIEMIGDKLVHLRNGIGKTQREVASDLGLKFQRYNHYETGARQPDLETLCILADYFNVTTDYLLGRNIKTPADEAMGDMIQKISKLNERDVATLSKLVDSLLTTDDSRVARQKKSKDLA
jgi:transcriptional regulator with XRE-family HTH domain